MLSKTVVKSSNEFVGNEEELSEDVVVDSVMEGKTVLEVGIVSVVEVFAAVAMMVVSTL